MRNTIRLFGTLSFRLCVVVLAAAVGFGMVACDSGTTSNGGGGGDEDIEVSLIKVEANGSASQTTNAIYLTFDKAIDNLQVGDVRVSGSIVTKTGITGSGTSYTLAVTVSKSGKVSVSIDKAGYRVAGGDFATVFVATVEGTPISLVSVVQDGSEDATTKFLTLTFSENVPGLSSKDITLGGAGAIARKGALRENDNVYTMAISNFTTGDLIVDVSKYGYTFSGAPVTVKVFVAKEVWGDDGIEVEVLEIEASQPVEVSPGVTRTTSIYLIFDKEIVDLREENIDFSNITLGGYPAIGTVNRGVLSVPQVQEDGSVKYILSIYGTYENGTSFDVEVRKNGYKITCDVTNTVTIESIRAVDFEDLTANGVYEVESTTEIYLTFSAEIPGLVANDIKITGVRNNNVSKSGLSNDGPVYTLRVSNFTDDEEVTVEIIKYGYEITPSEKTVQFYYAVLVLNSPVALTTYLGTIPDGDLVKVAYTGADLGDLKEVLDMYNGENGKKLVNVKLDLTESAATTIAATDFANATNLVGLTLGEVTISNGAFAGCSGLREIILEGALVTGIENGAFDDAQAGAAAAGEEFVFIIVEPQTAGIFAGYEDNDMSFVKFEIDTINEGMFENCNGITGVYELPAGILNVGGTAFAGTGIEEFVVNSALLTFDDTAIECDTVTFNVAPAPANDGDVAFPDSVKIVKVEGNVELDSGWFDDVEAVEELTLNGAVIPDLSDFVGLKEITIGSVITTGLEGADFSGLVALEKITVSPAQAGGYYTSPAAGGMLFDGDDVLIKHPKGMSAAGALIINGTTNSGLTKIGANAFEDTSYTSLAIGIALTSVGEDAFGGITEVTLTATQTSEDVVFDGITTLILNTLEADAATVTNADTFPAVTDLTLNGVAATLGALQYLTTVEDLTFGANFAGTTLTGSDFDSLPLLASINVANLAGYDTDGDGVLYNDPPTILIKYPPKLPVPASDEYAIPNSVSVGNSAFKGANLTGVDFSFAAGGTGGTIGNNAFEGVTGLATVTIPARITSIGNDAFKGSSLGASGLIFAATGQLGTIGTGAFMGTGITSVDFTNVAGLTTISANAFSGLSLGTIDFGSPTGTLTVNAGAFTGATLTSLTLPANVALSADSFKDSDVETLTITAANVTPPNPAAFSVTSPDSGGDPVAAKLVNLTIGANQTGAFAIPSITRLNLTGVTTIQTANYSELDGLITLILDGSLTITDDMFRRGAGAALSDVYNDTTGGTYTFNPTTGSWS